jgi:hypothetical protein
LDALFPGNEQQIVSSRTFQQLGLPIISERHDMADSPNQPLQGQRHADHDFVKMVDSILHIFVRRFLQMFFVLEQPKVWLFG